MMQHNSLYYVLVYAIMCDVIVLPKQIKEMKFSADPSEDVSEFVMPHPPDLKYYYTPWVATKAPPILPGGGGPYIGFLINLCNALLSPRFSNKYLGKYFSILSNSLKGLGIDYLQKIWIRRFRQRLKKYSIYNSNALKARVNDFLVFISDEKPKKSEYLKAMNAIYTVVDDMKMDNYVYVLKKYGKGLSKHIGENTRRVFERIMFGRYHRQSEDVKWNIELKFKSAVVEYWEERLNGTSLNFTLGHLFKYTLSHP